MHFISHLNNKPDNTIYALVTVCCNILVPKLQCTASIFITYHIENILNSWYLFHTRQIHNRIRKLCIRK